MSSLIDIEEPIGERIANALNSSVSWKPVQISLHAQDGKRPGARTGELERCRDRGFKEPSGRSSQSRIARLTQHLPQRPQGAAMAVIRPNVFKPSAVVTEEVSEPPGIGVESKP